MLDTSERSQRRAAISTGSVEIDRKIGGGIPYRTLMLIEGQSSSGKSTLVQQLIWGALTSGERAALYTTEQTVQSLLRQMESLGMDIRDDFLLGHLQIYPVEIHPGTMTPEQLFSTLSQHLRRQDECRVVAVDSLTTFVSQARSDQIQDFFTGCKTLCDGGKVVICTIHSQAFPEDTLTRVRSVCDAFLRLQVQRSGQQLVKTIEVAKIRGADATTGNISGFEVEPGLGIRIIPISSARA